MSIIFQLFSAEDLKELKDSDLNPLRNAVLEALGKTQLSGDGNSQERIEEQIKERDSIREALTKAKDLIEKDLNNYKTSDNIKDDIKKFRLLTESILAVLYESSGKLYLNLEEETKLDDKSELKNQEWPQKSLTKRFNEVFQQLMSASKDNLNAFNYDNLIKRKIDENTKEEIILRWAISCELNHAVSYNLLYKAQDAAYKKYVELRNALREGETVQPAFEEKSIKIPDSQYSPLNPRHPLYKQYYEEVLKSRKKPQQGA